MKNIFYKLPFKIICFIIISFLYCIQNANAQNKDSKGNDFWLMFDHGVDPTSLTLFITSSENTSGTVTVPGLSFSTPFTVTANMVTPVSLPTDLSLHTSDVIDNKGIHVTANKDVTVYGLNYQTFSTDAYLGLPTDVLGTEYIALSYPGSFGASEIGIVATEDNTTVTIIPTISAGSRTAGVPYDIVLNQGYTYELSGFPDVTGSLISSNKPIGVFGANACTNIPPGYGYCDHICEMLPPTEAWGKKFGTVPLKARVNGDTWRFLASADNTVVTINGVAQSPINKGQFIETILTDQSIIESNNAILAAQYSNGSDYSGNPGDPFMMLIPPLEQFLPNYTLTTVSGYATHYINLIAPNSVVGSLTLDGTAVPASDYTAIGSTGYSGAQLEVEDGSYTLNAGLPFGAFQYGFNTDDSYGYPGGQSFSPAAVVKSITLTPETGSGEINTNQCFTALAINDDNTPAIGINITFNILGANAGTTGFVATGSDGKAQFCYDGPMEGKDTLIASFGSLADTSYFTRTKSDTPDTCVKHCGGDSYGYKWKLCTVKTGDVHSITGTVSGPSAVPWNVWGTYSCKTGWFELHAINPNADNCASGYTDSFIYRGYSPFKCNLFTINVGAAKWKSYCNGNVSATGLVGVATCETFVKLSSDLITPAKSAGVADIVLKVSPNPVQNYATVSFKLEKQSKVNVTVYNYMMQPVKTLFSGTKGAGNQSVTWDAKQSKGAAVSGLYKIVAVINGKTYSTTVQVGK